MSISVKVEVLISTSLGGNSVEDSVKLLKKHEEKYFY